MDYAELQAHVLAACERPDLEQMLPDLIAMTESELTRRLRCRQMVGRATATLDNAFEVVPPDFAGARSFELASTPRKVLEYVKPDRLSQLSGILPTGEPIYYSVIGNEFRFAPAPSTSLPGSQLSYWRAVPALGGPVSSNWLLETYPDAYVYGALRQVGRVTGDARLAAWSEAFETVVTQINATLAVEDGGPR